MDVFNKVEGKDGDLVGVTVKASAADYRITRVVLLEKGTEYNQINSANVIKVLRAEKHYWSDAKSAQIRASAFMDREATKKATGKEQQEQLER